jgi:hypothetical protein
VAQADTPIARVQRAMGFMDQLAKASPPELAAQIYACLADLSFVAFALNSTGGQATDAAKPADPLAQLQAANQAQLDAALNQMKAQFASFITQMQAKPG